MSKKWTFDLVPSYWFLLVLLVVLWYIFESKVFGRSRVKEALGTFRNSELDTVWSRHADLGQYVGIHSVQGPRPYMEDTFQVESNLLQHHIEAMRRMGIKDEVIQERIAHLQTGDQVCAVFSVFDGHGGRRASEFCAQSFVKHLSTSVNLLTRPALALRETYQSLDQTWIANAARNRWDDGTTAVSALVLDGRVFVANAGDSRAVLCTHEGQGVALSYDHKPTRTDERDRIQKLGGRILFNGAWRVQGVLAVTRAIGDLSLKKYVTSEPDVIVHELTAGDLYLILASDGVWDVLSNDEACRLAVAAPDPKAAATSVVRAASAKGSQDNITALVIDMRPYYQSARARKGLNASAAAARRNSGGENMIRAVSKPSLSPSVHSPLNLQLGHIPLSGNNTPQHPLSPISPPSPTFVSPLNRARTTGQQSGGGQLYLHRAQSGSGPTFLSAAAPSLKSATGGIANSSTIMTLTSAPIPSSSSSSPSSSSSAAAPLSLSPAKPDSTQSPPASATTASHPSTTSTSDGEDATIKANARSQSNSNKKMTTTGLVSPKRRSSTKSKSSSESLSGNNSNEIVRCEGEACALSEGAITIRLEGTQSSQHETEELSCSEVESKQLRDEEGVSSAEGYGSQQALSAPIETPNALVQLSSDSSISRENCGTDDHTHDGDLTMTTLSVVSERKLHTDASPSSQLDGDYSVGLEACSLESSPCRNDTRPSEMCDLSQQKLGEVINP